jgi:hypothetical protein
VATVLIDNVEFKTGLSPAAVSDAKAKLTLARVATKDYTFKLRKSIKVDPAAEAEARDNLIYGYDARLVSAFAANKKLKPLHRQTLESCLSVPSLLEFSSPLPAQVRVHPKAKKSGGVRPIHNFGLLHRTSQHMVDRIMSAYYKPRWFQYTQRGTHAAAKEVKAYLGAGQVHLARLDIEDFYPSFELEKLVTELPLPKEVVENVVVGRHMKVVLDQEFMKGGLSVPSLPHTLDDLLHTARLGVPQGSACSPIVSSYCVSRLIWAMWFPTMSLEPLVNYADDFLLPSSSQKLLEKKIGALTKAVAFLPGGHFELKPEVKGDAANGFDFLGHRFQIVDGKLTTSPTEANRQALWAKLVRLDAKFDKLVGPLGVVKEASKQEALKVLAQITAIGNGWLSAFSECDDLKSEILMLSQMLQDACGKLDVTLAEVEKVIEPYTDYEPGDYALSH